MTPVLVDTCIWSLALRGKTPRDKDVTAQLVEIINAGDVLRFSVVTLNIRIHLS